MHKRTKAQERILSAALLAAFGTYALRCLVRDARPASTSEFLRYVALAPVLCSWLPLGLVTIASARTVLAPPRTAWSPFALLQCLAAVVLSLAGLVRSDAWHDSAAPVVGYLLGLASGAVACTLQHEPSPAQAPHRLLAAGTFAIAFVAFVCSIDGVIQHALRSHIAASDDQYRHAIARIELLFAEIFIGVSLLDRGRARIAVGAALLLVPHLLRELVPSYWQL